MAERFELYACGVELANGFGELTDPAEQRRRFEAEMDEKAAASTGSAIRSTRISSRRWRMMPPASGIALGFDRLVMLATGAPRIDLVQWVPRGGLRGAAGPRRPASSRDKYPGGGARGTRATGAEPPSSFFALAS